MVFMRSLARAVALGVVTFLFATPLMACVMESGSLSVTEAECCKAMRDECHAQVGPASHKCCRTFSGVPDASAPQKAMAAQLDQVAVLPDPAVQQPATQSVATVVAIDTSPPTSPPICSSVLRI